MTRRLGERGIAAIEFALLGPLAMIVLVAVVEVAAQATVAAALDHAARKASRVGITGAIDGSGQVATDGQRIAALRSVVLGSSGGMLVDANLTLGQSSYNTVTDASAGKNKSPGPGSAGQLVRYDLIYVQPLITAALSGAIFSQSQFTHTSTVLVKNEPFPSK